MCNNVIVLYIFVILKLCAFFIIPFVLILLRKKKIFKIILYINIVILSFLLLSNIFKNNACVYNSTKSGIELVEKMNKQEEINALHKENSSPSSNVKPQLNYKTYTGRTLYYYNQNDESIKNAYYKCNGKKVYLNTVGSAFTSLSISVSTLYNSNVNPVELFNYFKEDNFDMCNADFSLENIYDSFVERYGLISLDQISSSMVEEAIRNDGIVIAKLSSNENSKLTCDSNYIVIYSIDLNGKYLIADPALPKKSYVCPYSSDAYGNVISSDNMNKSWTFSEINNEAVSYYLVRRG